jgi:general secretion pathway protein K|tara:strand:+ start:9546 stop:10502 length:957 start_codon:yes stop_codon:yes gene_type:complete
MTKPGVILISTLLIVMVLSLVSMQISQNFYISLKREAYLDFKNSSYNLLISSEKQGIKTIQKEIKSYQSKLTLNDALLKNKFYYQNDLMLLEMSVSDASNCFNLNNLFEPFENSYTVRPAYRDWLARYLKLKLLSEPDIDSFIDQLIDWVDYDNQPLNFGAENYYYIGPRSSIKQFTPKRLLVDISEIKNFPVMQALNFEDVISNLCILPGSNKQLININSLVSEDALLIASFFDQENLEYTESQILSMPQNGYDEINSFAEKFTKLPDFPSQVLSLNSRTFALSSKIINENFSANLKTLVILELSSSAEILKRTFNF